MGGRAHRVAGAIVLAAALVLAFLVARGASFPVAGRAVPGWPQPPAVGSCELLADNGLRSVPCTELHDLEVTRTWQAFDTVPADLSSECGTAADAYLAPEANPAAIDGWQPEAPLYSAYQWSAPPDDVVGGRGWTVCVIAPWRPSQYVGSVRRMASLADRPAAYGMCGDTDEPILSPCDQPHNWEELGQATVDLPVVGSGKAMSDIVAAHQASCRQLAATLIGVSDPTYQDRLLIVVDAQRGIAVEPGTTITYVPGVGAATGGPSPTATPSTTGPASSTTGPALAPPPATTTVSPSDPAASTPALSSGATAPASSAPGSSVTAVPVTPTRPVAVLTCRVLDPHGQLVGSLMGWGDRSLPTK